MRCLADGNHCRRAGGASGSERDPIPGTKPEPPGTRWHQPVRRRHRTAPDRKVGTERREMAVTGANEEPLERGRQGDGAPERGRRRPAGGGVPRSLFWAARAFGFLWVGLVTIVAEPH